jgi:hypothetical protein
MAPQVCPRPGPHGPGPDCPLWDSRERIVLQRSIEADGAAHAQMSALVWADLNRSYKRPQAAPTRPVPITADPLAAIAAPVERAKPVAEKGVPVHV